MLTIVTADGCTSEFSIELNLNDFNFTGNGVQAYMISGSSSADDLKVISAMEVFPNPTNDQLNLRLNIAKGNNLTVKLKSVTGQLMLEENKHATTGELNETFDVSQWPSGMYLITVQSGTSVQTLKFTKQ